jgi:hypothetical protein
VLHILVAYTQIFCNILFYSRLDAISARLFPTSGEHGALRSHVFPSLVFARGICNWQAFLSSPNDIDGCRPKWLSSGCAHIECASRTGCDVQQPRQHLRIDSGHMEWARERGHVFVFQNKVQRPRGHKEYATLEFPLGMSHAFRVRTALSRPGRGVAQPG